MPDPSSLSTLSRPCYRTQLKDSKQVLQCLQRGLKVARSCAEVSVQYALYVEVLNFYIVYFQRECESVRDASVWTISLRRAKGTHGDRGRFPLSPRPHFTACSSGHGRPHLQNWRAGTGKPRIVGGHGRDRSGEKALSEYGGACQGAQGAGRSLCGARALGFVRSMFCRRSMSRYRRHINFCAHPRHTFFAIYYYSSRFLRLSFRHAKPYYTPFP